ncbi:contact-dependent growth inhibition system immunity protein [Gaopeijia maritima]|uniref:Contact-dependent growth inhibition system immunity protein n=1 Tax=Gaopeijia maritima TaxID=3119007 RepID=A0ABU9E922_9BACT
MSLARLLGVAFPPDWADRHGHPEEALAEAVRTLGPEAVRRAAEELDDIAGRGLCDMQLDALLAFECDCHLRPAETGRSPAGWLAWLAQSLDAAKGCGHFRSVER